MAERKALIEAVIAKVLAEAHERAETAGYSGEFGDRGAHVMRVQVEFYRHGMAGTIPSEWQKHHRDAENQADPEFTTYMRLKDKFEK